MFLLPMACFVGGIAGSAFGTVRPAAFPAISFLILGSLVAADLHMHNNVVAVLAICLGLVHRFFNGTALKEGAGAPGLLGIMAMIFVLVPGAPGGDTTTVDFRIN